MTPSENSSPSPSTLTPFAGKVSYKCPVNACKHNGKCVNGACHCRAGFSGRLCQREDIECKKNSCLNGGYCNDNVGNYTCDCPSGFVGSRCEKPVGNGTQSTISPTKSACGYCGNGSCSVLENGTAVCMCNPGFSGKTCTYSKNRCRPYSAALCLKGGECIVNSYRTNTEVCPKDWDGPLCRNESISLLRDLECPRVVCKNDGHCFNGRCCCRPGYTGEFCQEEILHCDSSPCKNGATCINLYNDYECTCMAGFTGRSCDVSLIQPLSSTTSTVSSTLPTTTKTTSLYSSTTKATTTESFTTDQPTSEETTTTITTTTEEETKQLTTDSISTVVLETSSLTASTSPSMISASTPDVTSESIGATSESTSPGTTQDRETTASTDSFFARCRGYQCFFNRTCIDTSYGRTKCKCMKVDLASFYIVNCTFIDFPSTTVASSVGSSSSFQTSPPLVNTSGTTDSIPTTTQLPQSTARSTHPSSPPTTAVVTTSESPHTGNNSVTLSGKIPDKDIPAVKEAITNAIKNTTKGKHLQFSRHCHANSKQIKGMPKTTTQVV